MVLDNLCPYRYEFKVEKDDIQKLKSLLEGLGKEGWRWIHLSHLKIVEIEKEKENVTRNSKKSYAKNWLDWKWWTFVKFTKNLTEVHALVVGGIEVYRLNSGIA